MPGDSSGEFLEPTDLLNRELKLTSCCFELSTINVADTSEYTRAFGDVVNECNNSLLFLDFGDKLAVVMESMVSELILWFIDVEGDDIVVFFDSDVGIDCLSFDDMNIGDWTVCLTGDFVGDVDLAKDTSLSSTFDLIAGDEGAEYFDEFEDKSDRETVDEGDLDIIEEFISLIDASY